MKIKTPKHTKGPWKIDKETTENGVTHVSIRAEPDAHLSIGPQVCKINYHLDFKNDMGNAHLIAAAPEMLECIATIYALADLQVLLETKYSKALVNDIMKMMDNTIKKARGES